MLMGELRCRMGYFWAPARRVSTQRLTQPHNGRRERDCGVPGVLQLGAATPSSISDERNCHSAAGMKDRLSDYDGTVSMAETDPVSFKQQS
jgi:hypothetical protein